jgi:DNA topoisomerase-1
VESPAKAKTIGKYLGGKYRVIASAGHIRDLPKSKLGVDISNDFTPQYENKKDKSVLINSLKQEAKKAGTVYLATDPDREGEAISWHLAHVLNLNLDQPIRVTFNEITKHGVEVGMSHPRKVKMPLVDAQQARRIMDRIVGYQLSPFLWRKVRRGLSAGRVQSVAVKIIVDREKEIEAFVPREYWSVDGSFLAKSSRKAFTAKLAEADGAKVELQNEQQTNEILSRLENAEYTVAAVKKSQRKKTPSAPFTTSTLQQEASKRLSFVAKRTMKAAQELYEGVEVEGYGSIGLITYMRTDSLRVSDEAKAQAAEVIEQRFGKEYLPAKSPEYKTKNNAQDAHEAIRPSTPGITPDMVKASLSTDQYKLYKLIWERFMASQMAHAIINHTAADITASGCLFRANGNTVKFDGYRKLYEDVSEEKDDGALPELTQGEVLKLVSVKGNQHFTEPPARYTEASLIKALEENGIGRPSTYAPTIGTILDRQYVERRQKQLVPTDLGRVINDLLEAHFDNIVDTHFTAQMETSLDKIELGKAQWVEVLRGFYEGFEQTLKQAEANMEGKRVKVPDTPTDIDCEVCGRKMVIKIGRYGKFLGCSGFPECTNTKPLLAETGGFCPKCNSRMLSKKSKKGRVFYGCENSECKYMTWDVPIPAKCPQCGATLFKKTGRAGKLYCAKENCGYEAPLPAKGEDGE